MKMPLLPLLGKYQILFLKGLCVLIKTVQNRGTCIVESCIGLEHGGHKCKILCYSHYF